MLYHLHPYEKISAVLEPIGLTKVFFFESIRLSHEGISLTFFFSFLSPYRRAYSHTQTCKLYLGMLGICQFSKHSRIKNFQFGHENTLGYEAASL